MPGDAFEGFREAVAPVRPNGPEQAMWEGLILIMEDGQRIDCVGVVLSVFDFGQGVFEIYMDALGVGYPLYERLFPQHVKAYKDQFS